MPRTAAPPRSETRPRRQPLLPRPRRERGGARKSPKGRPGRGRPATQTRQKARACKRGAPAGTPARQKAHACSRDATTATLAGRPPPLALLRQPRPLQRVPLAPHLPRHCPHRALRMATQSGIPVLALSVARQQRRARPSSSPPLPAQPCRTVVTALRWLRCERPRRPQHSLLGAPAVFCSVLPLWLQGAQLQRSLQMAALLPRCSVLRPSPRCLPNPHPISFRFPIHQ